MSRYEDCQTTSKSYDDTRVVIGTEILLGALATSGVPLGEQVVLDAGLRDGRVPWGHPPPRQRSDWRGAQPRDVGPGPGEAGR